MATEEKILKLVQKLHTRTKADEIQWEETPRTGAFQAAFPNYIVKLWTRPNDRNPAATDYIISIVDAVGTVIESASDVHIDSAFPHTNALQIMEELYQMARRKALGVDTGLDSLLNELG